MNHAYLEAERFHLTRSVAHLSLTSRKHHPADARRTGRSRSSRLRDRVVGALMPQQRPNDACHLGGQRHHDGVGMGARQQTAQPGAKPRIAPAPRRQRRAGTLDQVLAQVAAPALGDTEQPWLASGGRLPPKCAAHVMRPAAGSIATTQAGKVAAQVMTVSRRIRRRKTTLPVASSPNTLQLFLPSSIPSTDTGMNFAPPQTIRCRETTTLRVGGGPSIKRGLGLWYRPHERRPKHQAPRGLRHERPPLRPAPDARKHPRLQSRASLYRGYATVRRTGRRQGLR